MRSRRGCAQIRDDLSPSVRHEPHDEEDGHRVQPDDDKRLERGNDPARSRDGKPYGKGRAEDYPDDPAHIPYAPGAGWHSSGTADSWPIAGPRHLARAYG
jgi:hypothetical protein